MLVVAQAKHVCLQDDCTTLFGRGGWSWTLNCREALSQLGGVHAAYGHGVGSTHHCNEQYPYHPKQKTNASSPGHGFSTTQVRNVKSVLLKGLFIALWIGKLEFET